MINVKNSPSESRTSCSAVLETSFKPDERDTCPHIKMWLSQPFSKKVAHIHAAHALDEEEVQGTEGKEDEDSGEENSFQSFLPAQATSVVCDPQLGAGPANNNQSNARTSEPSQTFKETQKKTSAHEIYCEEDDRGFYKVECPQNTRAFACTPRRCLQQDASNSNSKQNAWACSSRAGFSSLTGHVQIKSGSQDLREGEGFNADERCTEAFYAATGLAHQPFCRCGRADIRPLELQSS